jgi:hypothetical protein
MKQARRMMFLGGVLVALAGMIAVVAPGISLMLGAFGAYFFLLGRAIERFMVGQVSIRDAGAAMVAGDWSKAENLVNTVRSKSAETRSAASILLATSRLAQDDTASALRHYDDALRETSSPHLIFAASTLRARTTAYVGKALALAVSHGPEAAREVTSCLQLSEVSSERFPLLYAQSLLARALIETGEKRAQCMQLVTRNARFLDAPTRIRWRKTVLADQRGENYRTLADVTQSASTTAAAATPQAALGPAGSLAVKPSRLFAKRTALVVGAWLALVIGAWLVLIGGTVSGSSALNVDDPLIEAEASRKHLEMPLIGLLNQPMTVWGLISVVVLAILIWRTRRSVTLAEQLVDLMPRAILGDAKALQSIQSKQSSMNSVFAVTANTQLSVVMLNHGRFQEALAYVDMALGRIAGASRMKDFFSEFTLHSIVAHRAEALCGLHRFDEARAEKNRLATEFAKLPQTPTTLYAIDLLIASASGDESQLQALMTKKSVGLSFLADTLWEGWNVVFSTPQSPLRAAQFLADTADDALLGTWLDATAPSLRARLQAMANAAG